MYSCKDNGGGGGSGSGSNNKKQTESTKTTKNSETTIKKSNDNLETENNKNETPVAIPTGVKIQSVYQKCKDQNGLQNCDPSFNFLWSDNDSKVTIFCEATSLKCSEFSYKIYLDGVEIGSKKIMTFTSQENFSNVSIGTLKIIAESNLEDFGTFQKVWEKKIDKIIPTVTINPDSKEQINGSITVDIACLECIKIAFSIDGTEPDFNSNSSVTVINGQKHSFEYSQAGNYTLKVKGQKKNGLLSKTVTKNYILRHECSGNQISITGFAPCDRTCGSGVGETNKAKSTKACVCKREYMWDTSQLKCQINYKFLYHYFSTLGGS